MADEVRFNWNGDAVLQAIRAKVKARMNAAGIVVAAHAKQLLSVSGVMTAGDVAAKGLTEPGFRHQFNRNRAFRMKKGREQRVRLAKSGKLHDVGAFKLAYAKAKAKKGRKP
jgi:hypothetical protein